MPRSIPCRGSEGNGGNIRAHGASVSYADARLAVTPLGEVTAARRACDHIAGVFPGRVMWQRAGAWLPCSVINGARASHGASPPP